jgi:uncharacterized membrane protein YhhN
VSIGKVRFPVCIFPFFFLVMGGAAIGLHC